VPATTRQQTREAGRLNTLLVFLVCVPCCTSNIFNGVFQGHLFMGVATGWSHGRTAAPWGVHLFCGGGGGDPLGGCTSGVPTWGEQDPFPHGERALARALSLTRKHNVVSSVTTFINS
jgi:hypothetical protein